MKKKNIKTAELIHSGDFQEDRVYYCIFGYLTGSRNFNNLLYEKGESSHSDYLRIFAALLAKHHKAGITQKDLHLDNFLWFDSNIYTVDGADIAVQSKPIELQDSMRNLSLFFAQFPPEHDIHIENFMSWYADARGWALTHKLVASLGRLINKDRKKRQRKFLRKTLRNCSQFSCIHHWNRRTIGAREYLTARIKQVLKDPDAFINNDHLLKDGASSTVANLTIDNREIVIKRYNIKNWKHALKRAFRPTRAEISWVNAHRLGFYGIDTPKPIALVEKRWGPIRKTAYFICEYESAPTCEDVFLSPKINTQKKQVSAKNVAVLFKKLFTAKISHGDLKATNLLISDESVALIDLDAMKQHRLNVMFRTAWKKDINRFYENWEKNDWITNLFKKEFYENS